MSLEPRACPVCGGSGWFPKSFRECGDFLDWGTVKLHPEALYKECLVCNSDGKKPLIMMRPIDPEEPVFVTNPAFTGMKSEIRHGGHVSTDESGAGSNQVEETPLGVSDETTQVGVVQGPESGGEGAGKE